MLSIITIRMWSYMTIKKGITSFAICLGIATFVGVAASKCQASEVAFDVPKHCSELFEDANYRKLCLLQIFKDTIAREGYKGPRLGEFISLKEAYLLSSVGDFARYLGNKLRSYPEFKKEYLEFVHGLSRCRKFDYIGNRLTYPPRC